METENQYINVRKTIGCEKNIDNSLHLYELVKQMQNFSLYICKNHENMNPYIFLDICHQSLIGYGPSLVLVHSFKNDGISRHPVYLHHY